MIYIGSYVKVFIKPNETRFGVDEHINPKCTCCNQTRWHSKYCYECGGVVRNTVEYTPKRFGVEFFKDSFAGRPPFECIYHNTLDNDTTVYVIIPELKIDGMICENLNVGSDLDLSVETDNFSTFDNVFESTYWKIIFEKLYKNELNYETVQLGVIENSSDYSNYFGDSDHED